MKALGWCFVVMLEQFLLMGRNHQQFSLGLRREHSPFVGRKMAVTGTVAIPALAQVARLVFIAGVRSVVGIQPRHLVEARHPIHRALAHIVLDPAGELGIAAVVEHGFDRHQHQLEALRHLPFPAQGIHPDAVATLLTHLGNPQKIPLQTAIGKVFVKHKGQLHRRSHVQGHGIIDRKF